MDFLRLKTPPIVEALVELRAEFATPPSMNLLADFSKKLGARYPTVEKQVDWAVQFTTHSNSTNSQEVGLVLRSPDGRNVIQARHDGLRVSRLAPYEHWDVFVAEVRDVWAGYVSETKPTSVTRLGVRFINRIDVRSGALSEFLDTRFEIGSRVPHASANFLVRVEFPLQNGQGVVVTQMSESVESVLLDIDAYWTGTMRHEGPEVWSELQRLRILKNEFFFGSVTDRVLAQAGGGV